MEESRESRFQDASLTDVELTERIFWFIRLRWLAAGAVLGAVFGAHYVLGIRLPVAPLVTLALGIAAYNAVFLVVLRRRWSPDNPIPARTATDCANLQITTDLVFLTLLIHLSGGVENPFFFFFIFHMIIASILLSPNAAYLQATLAGTLFSAVVILEYIGVVPHYHLEGFAPPGMAHSRLVWGILGSFISTLFLSVFMATSISQELRRRERETMILNMKIQEDAQKLQEAYKALSATQRLQTQYMRKVAHELRSPLGALATNLRVILEGLTGDVPPKQREMLSRAEKKSTELLKTVNDLLILSRSRSGRLQEQFENVAIEHVAERVIGLLSQRAADKNVTVKSDFPRDLPPVFGDPEGVEQVLTNLVANAIKYTSENGTVTVSAKHVGDEVRLLVSDTGIGIPNDDLPRIFDEFYRTKNARQFEPVGTGLGLAIVASIVEAHGGRIYVTSNLGQGTTFEVCLPVSKKAADRVIEPAPDYPSNA